VSLLVGYQPTGAVGCISYNMGTFDLPEIYTRARGPAIYARARGPTGPLCSCVYFRQITRAHVITITYTTGTFALPEICTSPMAAVMYNISIISYIAIYFFIMIMI